jgi:hypothetical protein
MSSDIDQKKLSVATDWISKLANGLNKYSQANSASAL